MLKPRTNLKKRAKNDNKLLRKKSKQKMNNISTFYLKRVAKLKKIMDLKLLPSRYAPPTSIFFKRTPRKHSLTSHTLKNRRENTRLAFLDRRGN